MSVRELLARVEAGDLWTPDAIAVSIETGELIERGLGIDHDDERYDDLWSAFCGAYDGSLDDALELHKAVLPEWVWWFEPFREIAFCGLYNPAVSPMPVTAGHANPARAWLIAILRALDAEAGR